MSMRWLSLWCAMLLCIPCTSHAVDVYRWTDEHGKAHVSDKPPSRIPRAGVEHDQLRVHELTDRQREEARARALANRGRRGHVVPALPPSYAQEPVPLTAPETPDQQPDESECQRLMRLYKESEACFAPYKFANGKTRPEAFEHCTPMVEPSIKCGYTPP